MTIERGVIGPPEPMDARSVVVTPATLIPSLVAARRTILELTGVEGDDINMENEKRKREALDAYTNGIELAREKRFNVARIITEVEKRLAPEPELPTR